MAEPRKTVEGRDELAPRAAMPGESGLSCGRQTIEAAASLAGLLHPFALHQALALETVEHGVKRCDVELELTFRLRFDQLGELVAVTRTDFKKRQEDHFRAAFLEVARVYISRSHIWR